MAYNKYRNKKTVVDGITFDSQAEAKRYACLKLMEKGHVIRDLELQPRYPLMVNGTKVGTYVGDFRYTDTGTGEVVLEDVKGMKTPIYNLKKKIMAAQTPPIFITEV